MKSKVTIRPGTKRDVVAFYGEAPKHSMKVLVAELDGKIVGLGGLIFQGRMVGAFSVIRDELRPYKKTIYRGALMLAEMAKGCGAVALADKDEPHSKELLQRLGFASLGETQFGEMFGWQQQHHSS